MENLLKENSPILLVFAVKWTMNLIFEVEDPIAFYLFETSKEDLLLFW